MGRTQGLPGSWGVHPIPLPRSTIPAGPAGLNLAAYPVRSPPIRQRGHQRCLFRNSITRLRYPLPTLHVVRCRTRMQGSLPAGGWPLPGGSRTHWTPSKGFRYLHSFPPSQAYPGATDFQSGEGDSRGLIINHLQRLPALSPATPRHIHATPNLSSTHSWHITFAASLPPISRPPAPMGNGNDPHLGRTQPIDLNGYVAAFAWTPLRSSPDGDPYTRV